MLWLIVKPSNLPLPCLDESGEVGNSLLKKIWADAGNFFLSDVLMLECSRDSIYAGCVIVYRCSSDSLSQTHNPRVNRDSCDGMIRLIVGFPRDQVNRVIF